MNYLKKEINEYYELAFHISRHVISYGFTEYITNKIQLMMIKYNQIKDNIYLSINSEKQNMEKSLASAKLNHDLALRYINYVTIILILLLSFISYLIIISIRNPLREIVKASQQVYKGNFNIAVKVKSKDVLGMLAISFNIMIQEIKNIMEQINKRNWLKTVEAAANTYLQVDLDLPIITKNILIYITRVINAQIGTLYLKNEQNKLELISCYTYDRNTTFTKIIDIGETSVGEAALKKETIYSKQVSNVHQNNNSGNIHSSLDNFVCIPLIYNKNVEGVLELGSFYKYSDIHIQFLRNISRNIAVAFRLVITRVISEEQMKKLELRIKKLNSTIKKLKESKK